MYPTLSPPWYSFANEVKYTYGKSPYVKVQDLVQVGEAYELKINVCNDYIAAALREILPLSKDFGGVLVNIIVYNRHGEVVVPQNIAFTPETLAKTICTALYANPLFVGTILTEGKFTPEQINVLGQVVVVIKQAIVQFYNDNISDICSNFNGVAATVFEDVSNLQYNLDLGITFSTYDYKCLKPNDFYCGTRPQCGCRR